MFHCPRRQFASWFGYWTLGWTTIVNLNLAVSAWRMGLCVVVLLGTCHRAHAQSAENVAVVINEASAGSERIGEYYVRKRAIPQTNVIRIRTSVDEEISRAAYAATIEQPIGAALMKAALQDRILYIVLTKGVPLRVAGTTGLDGTVASVDSELTLLYRKMTGKAVPVGGRVDNPYYLGSRLVRDAQRFTHRAHDIYLVSRLDAFTVDEALRSSIVRKPRSPTVKLCSTSAAGWRPATIGWKRPPAPGVRGLHSRSSSTSRPSPSATSSRSWAITRGVPTIRQIASGGSGWGSWRGRSRRPLSAPTPARCRSPPDTWVPSDSWKDTRALFGGSPQTLIGDLLRDGATGVAGHVAETLPAEHGTAVDSLSHLRVRVQFDEALYLAIRI